MWRQSVLTNSFLTEAGNQKIPNRYKENLFNYKGGQLLEQVAHKGCKISFFREIQNLTGQVPEQPDLIVPVLTRGVE